jgi:N-ethylmaleimide reductase
MRAMAAGFDGVEIHGANGYLVDQFLQATSNQRTDQYGGSLENRFRFLQEVIEAISYVVPSQRIGVRLSPNGVYKGMGSPDFRELFTFVLKQLSSLDLAYAHLMDGLGYGFHNLGAPFTLADARKIFHAPIIGNVGYTQATAEVAIARGDADLIAFGRPYISNPDLVERFANGWPLAEPAPMSDWYTPTGAKGYTDFPPYQVGK